MKTYKIFALPAHSFVDRTSGVDFLRVIQPMKALDGYEKDGVRFEVKVFDHAKDGSFDWVSVFEQYDAVFFNYTTNDVGFAIMGALAQKYKRKLICDLDDDLFNILQDNPANEIFKKGSWGITVVKAILEAVDHVVCTNDHLKHSIMNHCKIKGISSIPNYIDLSFYSHRVEWKDRGYYKALHFGSTTHFHSLMSGPFYKALERIMNEYPNLTLQTVGAFIPSYQDKWGMRYMKGFGDPDINKWVKEKMPAIVDDADFMLVPLNENIYNRSKSSTKWLEASSCKLPGAWQNIRQYRELVKDGANGYLCTTEEDWYKAIKNLLDNAKLRKEMGEKAFETIQEWTIQKNVHKYAELLLKVLTAGEPTIRS